MLAIYQTLGPSGGQDTRLRAAGRASLVSVYYLALGP